MIIIEGLDIIRQSFTNIAEAIRKANGRNKKYAVAEMPDAIAELGAASNVLYYYNTELININQTEESIAMINCTVMEQTDVDGYFYLEFNASEACTVKFSFSDNDGVELWSPMSFPISEGDNTISIPHTYLKRAAGVHNFVVTCQCTAGLLTIYPRGVYFTVSSRDITDRLIDVDLDEIMDLSIKQTEKDESPSEIWAIGTEEGEIVVKSCKYGEKNPLWTKIYSCGEGIVAAIEFNGNWVLRDGEETYTIETEEEPFVFIVEIDGTLVVYQNGDFNNRKILDTEVSQLSVVRGYKSIDVKEQDQGLVCAYVKNDGTLWYSQYIYNTTVEDYIWDTPIQLEDYIDVICAKIYRLNDYRLGLCITTQNSNYWLLTDRMYIGGAITPERANITFTQKGLFNLVDTVSTGTACIFEDVHASQDLFYVEYTYPLKFTSDDNEALSDLLTFTVNDNSVDVENVYIKNNKLYIKTVEPVEWTRQSNANIQLVINNKNQSLWICTNDNNKMGLYVISETFNWIIEREITTISCEVSESQNIDFSYTGNISMPFIKTSNIEIVENPIEISYTANNMILKQSEIITSNTDTMFENADISFSASGTITITQTGTSPI